VACFVTRRPDIGGSGSPLGTPRPENRSGGGAGNGPAAAVGGGSRGAVDRGFFGSCPKKHVRGVSCHAAEHGVTSVDVVVLGAPQRENPEKQDGTAGGQHVVIRTPRGVAIERNCKLRQLTGEAKVQREGRGAARGSPHGRLTCCASPSSRPATGGCQSRKLVIWWGRRFCDVFVAAPGRPHLGPMKRTLVSKNYRAQAQGRLAATTKLENAEQRQRD